MTQTTTTTFCQAEILREKYANPDVKQTIDETFEDSLKIDAKLDQIYRLLHYDPTLTAEPL